MSTIAQAPARGTIGCSVGQARARRGVARRKGSRVGFQKRFLMRIALVLVAACGVRAQEPAAQNPFSQPSPSSPPPGLSSPALSSSTHNRELTLKDRADIYLESLHEPEALVRPLLGAASDQALDTPPQWEQGVPGYGRRVASGFATEFIARTIKFGVAAADHEDPRFYHSQLHGFRPRARYAIVHTFISPVDGGGQTLAFSRLAGIYGSAFIANAWYPTGYDDFAHGLSRGSTNLAVDVGFHVLREFAPDIKKRLFHK
jgi:hypothetical protein